MNVKKVFSFVFSIILAVGLLWGLFSFIEKESFFSLLRDLSWPFFAGYLLFSICGFLLRSVRCQWIIGKGKLTLFQMYQVLMVRQIFLDLLPMKVGELSYVILLKKRFQIPVEVGMSSMIVIFLFDSISLFPILFLSLLAVGMEKAFLGPSFIWLSLGILVFLVFILWGLPNLVQMSVSFLRWFERKFFNSNKKWFVVVLEKGEKISSELNLLKARKIYLKTFWITFGIRFFKYLSIYSLLLALLASKGVGLESVGFLKMIIALTGSEVTTFLPIQGLGGFGTWEAGWVGAFVWLGLSYDLAVLSGFGTHLLTQITEYIVGGICLLLLWRSHRNNRSKKSEKKVEKVPVVSGVSQ